MIEFVHDLSRFAFLRHALLAGLLASVACGIVGSYVTVRRTVSIAGAIAHSTLGGMGVALYLNRRHGWSALTPLHGAIVAALVAAFAIGLLTRYGKQREDTVLSAVWSIGMAVGLLFISRTDGYSQDLMSYLFGNILMVRGADLWLIALLDVVVAGLSLLLHHKLQALCFDEEFARLRGIRTGLLTMVLLGLTALTVVVLVQIVGIVMVIALLALPAATAAHLTRRLGHMMVVSVGLSMICTTGGLVVSYRPDLPAGPTIILVAGIVYLITLNGALIHRRLRRSRTTQNHDDVVPRSSTSPL
jgi:zinc transport system permease protein